MIKLALVSRASRQLKESAVYNTFIRNSKEGSHSRSLYAVCTGILINSYRVSFSHYQLYLQTHAASRELHTVVTLLLLLAVHTTIYVFEAVSWGTLYINNLLLFLSDNTVQWLTNIGNVADSASCIVRLWNFWIYIVRVPNSWYILNNLFKCEMFSHSANIDNIGLISQYSPHILIERKIKNNNQTSNH